MCTVSLNLDILHIILYAQNNRIYIPSHLFLTQHFALDNTSISLLNAVTILGFYEISRQ